MAYSNKDLAHVLLRAIGAGKDPTRIKAARAKYTTGAINTIAPEDRVAFVADVEELPTRQRPYWRG